MKRYVQISGMIFLLLAGNAVAGDIPTPKFFPLPPRNVQNTMHPLNLQASTAPKFFPINNAGVSARAPMPLTANRIAPSIKTAEELPPAPAQNNSKPKTQLSETQAKQILSLYAQND